MYSGRVFESKKYKYNGKELDRTHGLDWYDYCARQYDPASGSLDRDDWAEMTI